MTFLEALREIESFEFSARVNVASDFKTFLEIASTESAVSDLSDALKNEVLCEKLLSHVLELCKREYDVRYENPLDAALTIYLWLMGKKDFKLTKIMAESVARIQQGWWSLRLAQFFLLEGFLEAGSGVVYLNFTLGHAGYLDFMNTEVGDSMLLYPSVSRIGELSLFELKEIGSVGTLSHWTYEHQSFGKPVHSLIPAAEQLIP